MIRLLRILGLLCVLYVAVLTVFDSGAGMQPIWLAIAAGFFLLSIKKMNKFLFSKKSFLALLTILISFFIIVEGAIVFEGFHTLNNKKSDYVIVLGARVKGETPSLTLKFRLEKAYSYLSDHPESKAVLSGGQGPGENISEAEAMRWYLTEKGIENSRLLLESESTSTYENLRNSFKIIDRIDSKAEITVVTSRFHILRSKKIAQQLGKTVDGIGAQSLWFLIPNYYLREFFAVVKAFVL